MLKGCKYFHFRPFSDKFDAIILLKSSKTLFMYYLNFFWNFLSMTAFPKKSGSATSEPLWTSNLMHAIPKKVIDRVI